MPLFVGVTLPKRRLVTDKGRALVCFAATRLHEKVDITAAHIAWVRITPFDEPRDQWVDETVPNLAWANPSEYPVSIDPPETMPGDLNGDQRVNGADLGLLLSVWNSFDPEADLDGSGFVDGADIGLLLSAWTG